MNQTQFAAAVTVATLLLNLTLTYLGVPQRVSCAVAHMLGSTAFADSHTQ